MATMKRVKPRPWQAGAAALVTLALAGGLALGADDPNVMFPDCGRTDDIEAAKIAHKAAAQLFERSEYDRAIENWRDAYKLDCKAHGLLINAASAYEKKGDKESAIAMLEAYLRRAPSAPDATSIIQKIDVLRTSLPPKVDPVPTATATVAPTARPIVRPPPPLPKPERPYGVKPWFVVGAGGVAILAGAILVPVGLGLIAEAEEACGGGRMCEVGQKDIASRGNTGRAEVIAGDVAISVGIAAIAGGLVWQFALNKPRLQKRAPEGQGDPARPTAPEAAPPPVSFAPFVGPGFGGVAASGSF